MKRCLFALLVLLATAQLASGQVYYEEESDSLTFKDRSYFGGNLALNIFGENKFIDVSPLMGYMVTPRYSVGAGLTYQYISRQFTAIPSGDRFTVSSSVYGWRVFNRYNVNRDYFAYAEFETLSAEFGIGNANTEREWVPGLLLGGGTFLPMFNNGGINVMILYNVLHDNLRSPYNSEWVIRGGITL